MKKENHNKNDFPIYLFHQGTNYCAYDFFGAHFTAIDGKKGVVFRTWAPNANHVSVVGDFNGWDYNAHPMNRLNQNGVYEVFVEGVEQYSAYKYAITHNGSTTLKADPYAFHAETPSKTASKVYDLEGFVWHDKDFIKNKKPPYNSPINIYEVHLGSWKRHEDGRYYTYREYATELVNYVYDMGYTHVEFLPLTEFPFDGSWGYQVTGYYAITSRFGTPKDFMYLVDCFHKKGISVILDWVPAHFCKDEHGLFEFDGTPTYEYSHWSKKEHKEWGTRIFDWSRNEVKCFLISNALFLLDKFHLDGLRVDAVASMLYLDYDKKPGEWELNEFGGNYNLEAIEFFKSLNTAIFSKFPNTMVIAEESTAFPMITKPVNVGGLGFNFKWNMGWMNDVLSYMSTDPYFRSGCHDKLTFSLCYAFSENFILPISHDEVVHGKKSLLDKMFGTIEQKFASLRAFNAYMFAHPGKKLNFMGNEFGQFKEWVDAEGLEFFMLKFELHNKLKLFNKRLNNLYKSTSQLFEIDDSWDGFNWVSVDERNNNVLIFERKDKSGNLLLTIINFSGNDYSNYRVGVDKGEYKIILNTDNKIFGGNGLVKKATFKSQKKTAHGRLNSINLRLPPFSALYLIKVD